MSRELPAVSLTDASDAAAPSDPRLRSRLLWISTTVLVLLVLVVTPPLLKLNRYAKGIALSMSQSLGRPVHLDNVSLGLFPVPHLTLQNVVVSEDATFGSEPIIRANIVEANLRASSLWRRPMEFSRVRFVEPSVNLVRNADGHWNLEGVLVHASQVNTAPTVQQHRGSAPRFPYIEATGGRVNVKIGEEKKPFSLTDTDFALWLPSPEQWSVRLTGTPARTDTNLNDPGTLRLEGTLQRAAHMDQVPVNLQLTWRNAPLGEATRLLTGDDQGWRGTVQIDAALKGSLGASRLAADLTLDDLRRAEFVPAHTLSVHLRCVALTNIPAATLQDLACNLPAGGAEPLRLQAERVDLSRPLAAGVTAESEATPVEWFASWARLMSPRFPPEPAPGTLDATLTHGATASSATSSSTDLAAVHQAAPAGWIGSLTLHLPLPPENAATRSDGTSVGGQPGAAAIAQTAQARNQSVTAEITPALNDTWRLTLPSSPVRISADSTLNFSGTATPNGYTLHAAGQASPASLLRLAGRIPPLSSGLPAVLGVVPATAAPSSSEASSPQQTTAQIDPNLPARIDLTCSRDWDMAAGDQTCARAADPVRKPSAKPSSKGRH